MEECKDCEWLDIKELAPLHYMHYVAKCFLDTTGHSLKGLGLHTKWIRAQSYYHWKVAKLNQLQHCPHLRELPVPPGPMECPSALQQPQRPNRLGAMAPGTSGSSGAGCSMTSESSGKSSWMEGGAGDGSSWFYRVTRTEAGLGACKRKKTNAEQQAPGCPFHLIYEEANKEVMGAIYEHMAGWEPPQRNVTLRAISAYYPDFTPATVKAVAGQVLCMIAEYHLACASMGSTTTSPISPEAVEQYLPPLVDYTCPGSTGLTDVRVCDHKSHSLCIGVWLHRMDMSLSWEREASESLVQLRHVRGPLLSYLLAPRTGNLCFEEVVTRVLQENWEKHERVKERFRSSLNSSHCQQTRLSQELDELSQGREAAADKRIHKETKARMGVLQTALKKVEASMAESKDHLEESWMREEEAHQEDRCQSNSSEGDVIVEGAEESGPTGAEATDPPIPMASIQETEPSMEVDMDDIPLLTSKDAATVTPEEDEMLTGRSHLSDWRDGLVTGHLS